MPRPRLAELAPVAFQMFALCHSVNSAPVWGPINISPASLLLDPHTHILGPRIWDLGKTYPPNCLRSYRGKGRRGWASTSSWVASHAGADSPFLVRVRYIGTTGRPGVN